MKSSDQTDVAKLHSNEYIHAHKCLHTHTLQNVAPYIILFLCSPFTCYFAITIEPLNKKSLMIIKSDKHFIRGLSFDCWIYLSSLGKVRMGRSDKITTYYIYKTTSISSCIKGHFLLALFSQLTTILRIYCFNTKCMLYVCVLGSTNGSVDTDRVHCYLLIFEYISFYVYVILLNNGMNSSLHL